MPPELNDEDIKIIKEYLLNHLLLEVLERDLNIIKPVNLKMKDVYVKVLRYQRNNTIKQLSEIRKKMRKQGLSIYEEHRDQVKILVKYLCRGYHYEFSMLWPLVKAELQIKLSKMFGIDFSDPTLTD